MIGKRSFLGGLLTVAVLLFGLPTMAIADPLDDARAAGLVGEMPDGYVGLVSGDAPANIKALVQSVNNQRRSKYESISTQKGVPVEQVGAITAEKIINEKLQPGWYYMDSSGVWRQR